MQTSGIVITIAVVMGVISLAVGLFLGALPSRGSEMTEKQGRISSMVGFVIAIIYIVFMLLKQDLSTWTILGGVIFGFIIGKIPPVHSFFVDKWDFFKPAAPKNKNQRNKR